MDSLSAIFNEANDLDTILSAACANVVVRDLGAWLSALATIWSKNLCINESECPRTHYIPRFEIGVLRRAILCKGTSRACVKLEISTYVVEDCGKYQCCSFLLMLLH